MRLSKKFVTALLILIMIAGFSIPALQAAPGQQSPFSIPALQAALGRQPSVVNTIGTFWWYWGDGGLIYAQPDAEGFAVVAPDRQPPVVKATIGTFWWYRGDGGLIYAQPDAEGFAQALEDDGCTWSINRNDIDNHLCDYHLEDTTSELIDKVDLAYFVGHSGETALGIHKPWPLLGDRPFVNDPEYAEAKYCKWGDDRPNKWVVLATCQAGNHNFASALQGTNLILGWESICDDWIYGPVFANKIMEGMTLKQAWFETAEECQHVPGVAQVLGENWETGSDHLKGYGPYCDPEVDDYYSYWKYPVTGWQELHNWILADDHTDTGWTNEGYAYDGNSATEAVFKQIQNGWSDPLILELDNPTTIRGFRIKANRPNEYDGWPDYNQTSVFDEILIQFYSADDVVTSVSIYNWEGGCWRIIDFANEDTQYYADVNGEEQPVIDSVKIRFLENDPDWGFFINRARIKEFDLWEVGGGGNGDGDGDGDGDNGSKPGSSELELVEEITVSQSMSGKIFDYRKLKTEDRRECEKILEDVSDILKIEVDDIAEEREDTIVKTDTIFQKSVEEDVIKEEKATDVTTLESIIEQSENTIEGLKSTIEEKDATQNMGMGMRGIDESKPSTDYAAYTVVPDAYDPAMFASVANAFSLKGEPTYTDDIYLLTGENGKSLKYNTQNGVWRYVNPSEAYPTVSSNPRLPSDAEAVALATAFMEENGFSSDDIVDAVVTYQKQGAGIKGTDTVLYEWIIAKNVYFKKEINGLPIMDKTTVTIGEGGTIAAFTLPTHTVELTDM